MEGDVRKGIVTTRSLPRAQHPEDARLAKLQHQKIRRGSGDQREQHGGGDGANDRDRQWAEHVGTRTDAVGQRQHAEGGGEGGHQNRAQATTARMHQGFAQIHSAGTELFNVIQHENPVLVDDAHANDGAQVGDDAQGGAGDQQCEDDAQHGEHGAEDDGDRSVEGTEFQQGHGEHEDDGHDQHDHQVAERFLLLLIKSAVFNAAGRETGVGADEFADLRHGAAEIAALQAGGDGNVLAHVFAVQFEFARGLDEVGHLMKLHDGAIGGPQREFAQQGEMIDGGRVQVHADADDAVAFEDGGGGLAEHGDVDGLGNVVGVQAVALRVGIAHSQMDRRASVNQTVEAIHYAGHSRFGLGIGSNQFFDVLRFPGQKIQVGGKNLHFDRFVRPDEVADEVAQNAGEIPVNGRQGGVKLPAQVGHDGRGGALAVRFQFDQEVAGVQFHQMHAQGGASAARIALHFGRGFEDFFRLAHLAVGFHQTGAGRRHVINDESAFVHLRQEIGFQARI